MVDDRVVVRPATPGDAEAVAALLVAQLGEHRIELDEPVRLVEELLRLPQRGRLLVAVREGVVVGVALLSFLWTLERGGQSAWLDELYVRPEDRGRGIGLALLRAASAIAAESGAGALDLEVDEEHRRAEHLYEREGFRRLPRARWWRRLASLAPAPAAPPATLTGGCFCGAVRYRVAGPARDVAHCHCGMCRRTTGAPFVTWATVATEAFAFTAGTPAECRSSERARRTFCGACGTALTFREIAHPESIDVTVGSLDDAARLTPQWHIWTASQLPWIRLDDDLPRHEEENPAERAAAAVGPRRVE